MLQVLHTKGNSISLEYKFSCISGTWMLQNMYLCNTALVFCKGEINPLRREHQILDILCEISIYIVSVIMNSTLLFLGSIKLPIFWKNKQNSTLIWNCIILILVPKHYIDSDDLKLKVERYKWGARPLPFTKKHFPSSRQLYLKMETGAILNFLVIACEGHLKHYVPFMGHDTQTGQNVRVGCSSRFLKMFSL